ncbi:hypothetical protein [Allorhodopirellula solitaria]|uniref:Uncharacterized protein n=1 Tax=Allorhodopirellula solitaria TaxID=2527987 RepID=A0A5C5WWM9_9BACT|nr:hypothetical protein [Allorhodopirellula solitaria]TWT55354.1 hypothetical protein CA85_49810 [Allorhodopirellula solitaria]
MATLPKRRILDSRLAQIGHSHPSKPEFVLEGIGPAEFRSHYLRLESGVVLDLFIAELSVASRDEMVCSGETDGIPCEELIGRTVTGVWNDDTCSCIVILDNDIYLKDANDGVYGNPLRAGWIVGDYSGDQRQEFTDYWTEEPIQ